MKIYKYSNRSLNNINGLNSKLIILLGLMLNYSPYDFVITEGLRTKERQIQLVEEGKSKTLNSKHLIGNAFDIAILDETGKVTWDLKYYAEFAEVFLRLAKHLGFNCEWGGSWKSFVDGPHFQIND